MKIVTTIAISTLLLIGQGCKKCYRCHDGCCTILSNNSLVCSSQFTTYQEYHTALDSLGSDVSCAGVHYTTSFYVKTCNSKKLESYEALRGVSCVPLN